MINVTSTSGHVTYGLKEFIVDTRSEIDSLPIDSVPGSSCLVLEDFSIWLMNSNNQWIELG